MSSQDSHRLENRSSEISPRKCLFGRETEEDKRREKEKLEQELSKAKKEFETRYKIEGEIPQVKPPKKEE